MKIISLDAVPEECRSYIKCENLSEDDFSNAEALIAWPRQINQDLMKGMKRLKAIQTFSAGVDDLDFSVVPGDVKVFSNAGSYSRPVAEQAWALALTLAKGTNLKKKVESYQITGRNVMLLGGGGIGTEIARIANSGFNNRVIGLSRSFNDAKSFDKTFPLSYFDKIIGAADYIFDALPLNKQTNGFLNYSTLKNVKERAIIVNVGRGETVVEDDMYRLLTERRGVRFGTDVFWRKDGVESFETKLWQLDNFAGTLHTAGAYGNKEVLNNAKKIACENALRFAEGLPAKNEVKRTDYI